MKVTVRLSRSSDTACSLQLGPLVASRTYSNTQALYVTDLDFFFFSKQNWCHYCTAHPDDLDLVLKWELTAVTIRMNVEEVYYFGQTKTLLARLSRYNRLISFLAVVFFQSLLWVRMSLLFCFVVEAIRLKKNSTVTFPPHTNKSYKANVASHLHIRFTPSPLGSNFKCSPTGSSSKVQLAS